MAPFNYLKRGIITCLMLIPCLQAFAQVQGNYQNHVLEADFTHQFLVDAACIHPQDQNIIMLVDQSTGAIARTQWISSHPKVATILPGLKGSTLLSLDMMRGSIPQNVLITMIATDSAGNSDTISKTIPLNIHFAPIVRFKEGIAMDGCASNPITFEHTTFSMHGTGFTAYEWNFGDGTTSTSESPSHTYQSPGTYNVSLKVTDNTGCTGGNHPAIRNLRAKIGPAGQCN